MSIHKQNANIILKGVAAGICIALGLYASMQFTDAFTSYLMFSVGLLSIFTLNLYLYTGLVPYATSNMGSVYFLLEVFISNCLGAFILLLLPMSQSAVDSAVLKLSDPWYTVLVQAILCNIFIYIAVEANKKNNVLTIILAVVGFLACGFEHSVANVCLFILARQFSWKALLYILLSVIGNAIGGIFMRKVCEGFDENRQNRKRLVE